MPKFLKTKDLNKKPGSGTKTEQNPNRSLDPLKKGVVKLNQKQKRRLDSLVGK